MRDAHSEGAAFAFGALTLKAAAVRGDAAFGDGKAEAGARCVADIGAAMEGIKEMLDVHRGNALAVVGDGERDVVGVQPDAEFHGAAFG